jgi:hypothetical protein
MGEPTTLAGHRAPEADDEGPIPAFPPRALDEQGRLIPLSDEERKARTAAALRALKALDRIGDEAEQRATLEALKKGIDEHRGPGWKLFS